MPRVVKCPFYVSTRDCRIKCEDGLQISFPDTSTRLRFWIGGCCGDWERCTIAKTLWDRWERIHHE